MEENKYNFLLNEDRSNDMDELDLSSFEYPGENKDAPIMEVSRKPNIRNIKRKGDKDIRRLEIHVPFDIYLALTVVAKASGMSVRSYLCSIVDKELCQQKDTIRSIIKMMKK